MKRTLPLSLALAFWSTLLHAKTPSKPADFSGNWVLDASQTKDLPLGLQSYSMVVNQDKQQLEVHTTLQGDLQATGNPNGPYPGGAGRTGGGYPGRRGSGMGRIGIGMPGGGTGGPMGEGMPGGGVPGGGGGGRPRTESQSEGRIAALTLYPSSAVYKLDGAESAAQLGGPEQNDATLKADWAKSGKVLKLSVMGHSRERSGKTKLKDRWKLSQDGQFLMVDRAAHSPGGSATVHLVFRKDAGSTNGTPQGHGD